MNEVDIEAFEVRGRGDRHQFRFILSPEDATQREDLRAYKLTIVLSVDLKAKLDRHAVLHAELSGESVDGAALIPHMLEAFMVRDRAFRRA